MAREQPILLLMLGQFGMALLILTGGAHRREAGLGNVIVGPIFEQLRHIALVVFQGHFEVLATLILYLTALYAFNLHLLAVGRCLWPHLFGQTVSIRLLGDLNLSGTRGLVGDDIWDLITVHQFSLREFLTLQHGLLHKVINVRISQALSPPAIFAFFTR